MSKKINYFIVFPVIIILSSLLTGLAVLSSSISSIKQSHYIQMTNISEFIADNVNSTGSTLQIQNENQIRTSHLLKGYDFFLWDENGNYKCGTIKENSDRYRKIKFEKALEDDEYFSVNLIGDTVLIKKVNCSIRNSYYIVLITSSENTAQSIAQIIYAVAISEFTIAFISIVTSHTIAKLRKPLIKQLNEDAENYIEPDNVFSSNLELALAIIQKMNEKLINSEKQKTEFISNISHELKTPLTIINGFVGGILDGTIPKKDYNRYLVHISNESNRMTRLVKTMLKTSSIESGNLTTDYSDIKINLLLIEIMFMFEKSINNKNVSVEGLEQENDIILHSDNDIIYQIIYNLIENAVKFVDQNGVIQVNITSDSDFVYIKIINTGPGISENDMPKIFDKFYKTDYSRSTDVTGVGLGLSIVKKFVNSLNGNISINSFENKFTEVTVAFPVNPSKQ